MLNCEDYGTGNEMALLYSGAVVARDPVVVGAHFLGPLPERGGPERLPQLQTFRQTIPSLLVHQVSRRHEEEQEG